MKNAELRDLAEQLVAVEQRVDRAVALRGDARWSWAPWGKPSSGGPYLWNDIQVVKPDGKVRVVPAVDYIDGA